MWAGRPPTRLPAGRRVAGGGGAYDSELLRVGGSMATGPRGGPDGGGGSAAEAVRPTESAAALGRTFGGRCR